METHSSGVQKSAWLIPSVKLPLSYSTVHVWRTKLDVDAVHLQRYEQSLSDDERKKAGRFHYKRDRQSYIAARGILRAILARFLSIQPSDLKFCYGRQGKPFLGGRQRSSGIRFNLTKSEMLALYAVAYHREVGIDLEIMKSIPDAGQIAKYFFSAREKDALMAHPEDQRLHAFFRFWTRKEAYIKALGVGFSKKFDEFEVSLDPDVPIKLLTHTRRPSNKIQWCLCDLFPRENYIAAIAVEGHNFKLNLWDYSEGSK